MAANLAVKRRVATQNTTAGALSSLPTFNLGVNENDNSLWYKRSDGATVQLGGPLLYSPLTVGSSGQNVLAFTPGANTGVAATLATTAALSITSSAVSISGPATFGSGIGFGSQVGTNTTDVSKHIALFGSGYGLGVTGGRLNYVVPGAAAHVLVIGGSDVLSVQTGMAALAGTLTLTAPATNDNSNKVPTTNWVASQGFLTSASGYATVASLANYAPLGSPDFTASASITGNPLATTVTTGATLFQIAQNAGNNLFLNFYSLRGTAGSDWTGTSTRMAMQVDTTVQGFLEFNPPGYLSGVAVGTTTSGGTAQLNLVATVDGNLTSPFGNLTLTQGYLYAGGANLPVRIAGNQGGAYPVYGSVFGGLGYNFSAGASEINFWNTYAPSTLSFSWLQQTGASAATTLMSLTPSAVLTLGPPGGTHITLAPGALSTITGTLLVTSGGLTVAAPAGTMPISFSGNESSHYPASGAAGALGWNYSGGYAEVNFWNAVYSAAYSFSWLQQTAATTAVSLMTLSPTGALGVAGALTAASLGISGAAAVGGAISGASLGVSGAVTSATLAVTGASTFSGVSFGAAVGTSTTDLSKHIALYGTSYGINITGGRLNLVGPTGSSIVAVLNGVDILAVGVGNVSIVGNLSITGIISGAFSFAAGSLFAGITFGSTVGSNSSDLSKHIALYGTTWGFNVWNGRLDYVVPTGGTHVQVVNGVDVATVGVNGLTIAGTLFANAATGKLPLTFAGNSGGTYPGAGAVGGFGWNFTNGQGEVDLWNTYYGAAGSFAWYQQTAAGAATTLMKLGPGGALSVTGGVTATGYTVGTHAFYGAMLPNLVLDFGGSPSATLSGATDNSAAFTAAIASGKSFYVPPGYYLTTGYHQLSSNQYVVGAGIANIVGIGGVLSTTSVLNGATAIICTSATNSLFVIPNGTSHAGISNMSLSCNVSGGGTGNGGIISAYTGAYDDVEAIQIHDVEISNFLYGMLLGPTNSSWIENVTCQYNVSHGIFVRSVTGSGGTPTNPLQWTFRRVLCQFNGGYGMQVATVASGVSGNQVSVGEILNFSTFANSGGGLSFIGLPSAPIQGVRIGARSFIGGDGNVEIYFDTYGVGHSVSETDIELAGTGPTGRSYSTAASGIGDGIAITANNSGIIISACGINGCSYAGIQSSAYLYGSLTAPVQVVGCSITNNGLARVSGTQAGILLYQGYMVVGGGCSIGSWDTNYQSYGNTQIYGVYASFDGLLCTGVMFNYNASALANVVTFASSPSFSLVTNNIGLT